MIQDVSRVEAVAPSSRYSFKLALTVCLAILVGGCSGGELSSTQPSSSAGDTPPPPPPPPSPDTTAPTITSIFPADGATGVAVTTFVSAGFSEPLDPGSVSPSSFLIAGLGATAGYSGGTATLWPATSLAANTLYTVTVRGGAGGVRDVAGNPLTADRVWSFTTGSGGGSSVPRATKPRLWLDATTTARLVAAVQANSAPWQSLRSFCDTSGTNPDWDYQGYELSRFASNFSACYRIGKDAGLAAATVDGYAVKALTVLNNLISFTNYGEDSGYGIRNYLPGIAIAYDWLHDYAGLTDTTKTNARARMKAWIDWYGANGYARSDYDTDTRVSVYLSNYNTGYLLGRTLASIAMYGDDATSASYYTGAVAHQQASRLKLDEKLSGGHWPEGWSYGQSAYQFLGETASALTNATGDGTYSNFQWLLNNISFKLNAIAPNGLWTYDDGAWTGTYVGDPRLSDVYVAGSIAGWGSSLGRLATSYASLARNWPDADNNTLVGQWRRFLFTDPSASGADLSGVTRSYHAQGAGLVTYRSAWNAPNATWGSFIAGPYLSWQASQDADQGHIAIYKNAPLLVDAGHGVYTAPETRTVHHNTYTLLNRNGISSGGQSTTAGDPRCGLSGIGVKNYTDGGAWLFTRGDITESYRPEISWNTCTGPGIARLERNVFYLRPNLFFVYDQIEKLPAQAQVSPHMHLHFPTTPVSANANREITVTNSGVNGVATSSGTLHVASIFPAGAIATLTGNHLDVAAPSEAPLYHRFLHLLRAADTSASPTFPTYTAISGTDVYGVWVGGLQAAEASQRVAVVFADNGTTSIPTSISYTVPAVATQHYVLKLKINTHYNVSVTTNAGIVTVSIVENAAGTALTNAAGLLLVSN